jgi:hypothetical protein
LHTMGTGVLGVHWRVGDRSPSGIPFGPRIAVVVAMADRGDRPPEVVVVLGLENGD